MKDNAGLSAIYCTGIIGAAIYYIQVTSGFQETIWGLIKALFWRISDNVLGKEQARFIGDPPEPASQKIYSSPLPNNYPVMGNKS